MYLRDLWAVTLVVSSLAAASPLNESHLDEADGEATIAQTTITAVYGKDDRKEIYEMGHPVAKRAIASVVMLTDQSNVSESADGDFTIEGVHYGESLNLCKSEPFYDQPRLGFCSGVLIGEKTVLTAGHCITSEKDCADTRFVFDMHYEGPDEIELTIPAKRVRSCKRIVKRANRNSGLDYAILELDKAVTDRRPVPLGAGIRNPRHVFMLGHPLGLPAKFSGVAEIYRETDLEWIADLDSSAGNSGSPVFDAGTGALVGILTAGEDGDFRKKKMTCEVSKVCNTENCFGEVILKIQSIIKHAEL